MGKIPERPSTDSPVHPHGLYSRSEYSSTCPGFEATSRNTWKGMDEWEQAKIELGEYGESVISVRHYTFSCSFSDTGYSPQLGSKH